MEPSFFTNHTYFWGDVHAENLRKERAEFLSSMEIKGIRVLKTIKQGKTIYN
ncbi:MULTISPECIES: hypothetical protein [Bizionia]|uniref:hypothetical protein n=1 Tax=Bizionia TaxID=283785 RepID=UPI0012FA68BA|nr:MULTISPECIES: hypothetical protein [Bizionia]